MDVDAAVAAALAEAHRQEWGYVLAATARLTRDLDTAEECVQDAYAQALTAWAASGVPARPGAWLTTVARRRAMDLIRRNDTLRAKLPLLAGPGLEDGPDALIEDAEDVPDDRLRLICGLTTTEIASAFLVSEATMAARITRAKKKIAATRIPYRVPPTAELPERIEAVLDVVHLVFTTGHTARAGASLQRRDLAERALHLARVLHQLLPASPGVAGLLALILLTDARRHTRTGPGGQLQLLADQDRDQWDRAEIGEGITLVKAALRHRRPSRWALMAAIAAVHAEAPRYRDTDWLEIARLYDVLLEIWPSPVVALNRAIALGEAHGPKAGLNALNELADEPQLAGYHYLAAARGEFLSRLDRTDDARLAYAEALMLAENQIERDFLEHRLNQL